MRFKVRFWNADYQGTGFAVDVSASGLFVETQSPLQSGARIHIEITTPDGPFFGEAAVVRIARPPPSVRSVLRPGMGLRFVSFGERIRSRDGAANDERVLTVDLSDAATLVATFDREIKRGGLFIACEAPPEVNATVRLFVRLPPPAPAVEAEGIVVHVSSQPTGVGVQIGDVLRQKICDALR